MYVTWHQHWQDFIFYFYYTDFTPLILLTSIFSPSSLKSTLVSQLKPDWTFRSHIPILGDQSFFLNSIFRWNIARRRPGEKKRERERVNHIKACCLYILSPKGVTDPSCQMNFNKLFLTMFREIFPFPFPSSSCFFLMRKYNFYNRKTKKCYKKIPWPTPRLSIANR